MAFVIALAMVSVLPAAVWAAPIVTPFGSSISAESCLANNGVIDPGETVTVEFALRNTGLSNTTNLVATLLATNGVTSPSGAQTYGALMAGGGAVSRSFTFTANGACGGMIAPTFQLQDGATDLGPVSFNTQLGPTVPIFSENFDSVTPTNLPAGWAATNALGTGMSWTTASSVRDSAPNSAFAPDPSVASDNRLISPGIWISSVASQLSFRHSFNLESGFDGGRLEISIGSGPFTNLIAAGGAFVSNGYNSSIQFGSVPAWSGNSGGFITTTVNLPASAAGQTVRLRWRLTTDSSNSGGPYAGWFVDTVSLTEVQCCMGSASADLALTILDSPDPVLVESNLTYTLRVTNRGPATATAVLLTNTLPVGVTNVVSITASQGACTNLGGGLIGCNLNSLTNTASATVTIVVRPGSAATITNTAMIAANEPDFNLLNNTASAVSTVSLPALSINDVSVNEGNSGSANVNFTVTLSPASSKNVTVAWATADGTAVAPADYTANSGLLTYSPGQTSKTITVAVRGDTLSEANEVFSVVLSNPTNAMLTKAQGDCTIVDNDTLPTLSINNVGVVEGNSGTNAVFTVTLFPASGQSVSVDYATADNTAVAGSDYVADNDTITFDPGQTNQTIVVAIVGDTLNEANETFFLNLLNPLNATLADGQGVCTITNDDFLPTIRAAGAMVTAESCVSTNGAVDPGETVTMKFALKNTSTGTARTTNLVATLLSIGGVTSPSGPQNYGALTAGNSATNPFTFTATGTCGGTITATLQLQDGPNNLGTLTNLLLLGKPTIIFTQSFDSVSSSNLPAGWTASLTGAGMVWATTSALFDTPTNSVFARDPDGSSDNRLVSPLIPITTTSAQLTFRHSFSTDEFFDGGVLEIAIGGGSFTNIVAAGGSFSAGGYNGLLNNDSTRPAWTGSSGGFITTTASLPASAAGQNVQLRWRFLSDIFGGGVGWYVDTISLTDGVTCCGNNGPPSLGVARADTNVVLSWPSNAVGYSLQCTTNLGATSFWSTATNTVTIGNQTFVTNPIAGPSRFYRLIK